MKKKQQTVRRRKPSSGKNQGRPPAVLGDEKLSAPAAASHTPPVHAIKHSGLGLLKLPRPDPISMPPAKQGLSASERLVLSHLIRLRQQRKPATKDSLKKSLIDSKSGLREQKDAPASDADSQLRQLLQACATDSLEKYLAEWFPLKWLPALSISPANPGIKNKLIFRCFLVPSLCDAWVQGAGKLPMKMSLFLHDYSTRTRAFERLDGELRARAGSKGAGKTNVRPPVLPDWLNCTPEEATHRLERFDIWRKAALRSFWHFYGQFCADMGLADPKASLAAFRGFAQRETPLPERLRVLLEPLGPLNRSVNRSLSIKNQTKPKMRDLGRGYEAWVKRQQTERVPSLIIDCWLIEIWPLALAEEWTYESILTIAEAKFGALEELNDSKKLQKRCNRIKLRLAAVRRCGGRVLELLC